MIIEQSILILNRSQLKKKKQKKKHLLPKQIYILILKFFHKLNLKK